MKVTTLTISNNLIKKVVMAMFYGTCYASAYHTSNRNSIYNAFDDITAELTKQGWTYLGNGKIIPPKSQDS